MSTPITPRLRSLLRQADKVAGDNKRTAAEQLYRQLVEEAPDLPQAWLGLARVADPAEQAGYYEKVLALDPGNQDAQIELAELLGQAAPAAARPDTPAAARPNTPAAARPNTPAEAAKDEAAAMVADAAETSGLEPVDLTKADNQGDWSDTTTAARRFDDVQPAADGRAPAGSGAPAVDAEPAAAEVSDESLVATCYRHPDRETGLRCANCGRPICSSCANPTPVGYRCDICLRELEDRLYEATAATYLIAGGVALFLGLIAAGIMSFIGFWFIGILVGAGVGSGIGRLAFRAGGRRRGRYLPLLVAAMVLFSGLLFLFSNPIGVGVYLVFATSAAYYQLR